MNNKQIDSFLTDVTKHLNRALAWKLAAWILFVTGVCLLAHALIYRFQGQSVPWSGALVILFYSVSIGVALWFMRLRKRSDGARIADQELGLKDALSSAYDFEKKEGEVFSLQLQQTEQLLKERKAAEIPSALPRRPFAVGGVLAAVAIGLGFLPPSLAVRQQLAEEELMENRTEEIRTELEEFVEELLEEMDADEREVLNPDELKEWVKELKRTKDQKEAMRQLARFEQKITKAMAGLEAREDEESLKLAAAELAKSDQAAARQLGKHLDLKDFKMAEEDLKKAAEKAKLGKKTELKEKDLKLKKEELKKLREMTKRMANSARKRGGQKKGKKGKMAGKMAKGNGKEMDQLLQDLDDAARDADQFMEQIDGEFVEGDFDKMEAFRGKLDKNMKLLRGRFRKLHGKNKARKRLAGLRAGLGKAQQFANGQTQMLGLAQSQKAGQGGLRPGQGSNESRRRERDELKNNQNFANLEGQQGSGPSITSVEDAESGTGISGKTGEAKVRKFQRQMESFVRRDDGPEDVKMGVKEYFERVHEVEEKR